MLEGTKTKYICASDRQRRMIAYFENEGESVSSVVPFPVNTEIFKFSATSRAQVRKRLGISSDKKLLLYTGRLSLQKCIIRLLEEFHQLVREGNHDLCLALAGPYDDLGGMTSNIRIPVSYYFHQVQEKLRSLPKKIQEKIFFLGDLEVKDLTQIYSAADLFVSISLHHDEDYGMCPGEALSSGLPCILTDWGGYPGFQKGGLPVELIPVALGKRGLEIDSNILKQLLRAGIQNLSTPAQRKKTGAVFAKNFGIHAVAEQLKASFCDEEFKATGKFRWTLEVVARNGSLTGDLYKEVYGQYVHQSAN